jgi:hypothetical protein
VVSSVQACACQVFCVQTILTGCTLFYASPLLICGAPMEMLVMGLLAPTAAALAAKAVASVLGRPLSTTLAVFASISAALAGASLAMVLVYAVGLVSFAMLSAWDPQNAFSYFAVASLITMAAAKIAMTVGVFSGQLLAVAALTALAFSDVPLRDVSPALLPDPAPAIRRAAVFLDTLLPSTAPRPPVRPDGPRADPRPTRDTEESQ